MTSSKNIQIVYSLIIVFLCVSCTKSRELSLKSPDGKVLLTLYDQGGTLTYTLHWDGNQLIDTSSVSIFPGKSIKVMNSSIKAVNEQWNPIWGQFSEVMNEYNELTVSLDYSGIATQLHVRSYDHGLAFRFEVPEVPENSKPSFLVQYHLPNTNSIYMPAGEREPIGPIEIASLSEEGNDGLKWKMPIVIETDQQQFLSLLESDLMSAEGFDLVRFGFEQDELLASNSFTDGQSSLITPWRIILLEENIGDLLTNTVPLNVAAPLAIENPLWIKPGKAMWDWRVHGHTTGDGFTYGINTESYLRYIDFASENGIEYFLIDANWYDDATNGQLVISEALDYRVISNYAKERAVALILYYDRKKGDFGDEALFLFYSSLDAKGIKYGFMGEKTSFTRSAIRASADNHLLIDFHDSPLPMTGVERTYPNAITREFCHAQQDYRRAFTPDTFIKMAMINAIHGPLDMNNGVFDISGVNAGNRLKGPKKLNSLITTVTAEAARTLIINSGLVCLPDAPEAYRAKLDLFEFIKNMPVGKWDESKILHAKMGEYISTARRYKGDWFIGSVHAKGGVLDINLDFLEDGKNYDLTTYEDTNATNSRTNPESYQVRNRTVEKGHVIKANIAAGSGHCMWIKSIK